MIIVLLVVLLVLTLGALPPVGPVAHPYGYYPSSILGTVFLILLILMLLGRL